MKKLLFSLVVAGLITTTSCKKSSEQVTESTTDAVEKVADQTATAVNEMATVATETVTGVPTFSNPEVQQFANDYSAYINQMVTASQSGDAATLQTLTSQAQSWATKTQQIASKMTPEDAKLWQEYAQKLQQTIQGK